MTPIEFALVGGFLGAGKTSLLVETARRERLLGRGVAVISNDQGCELVDSEVFKASDLDSAEVTGGCFCCRFDDLVAATSLVARANPDLILAEAVGSCTDLAATVHAPMRRLHGDRFFLAPLTIVVDPVRASRMLSRDDSPFPPEVAYLFVQQIREADIVLLNKADNTDPSDRAGIGERIRALNPSSHLIETSATTGAGLDEWRECLRSYTGGGTNVLADLDYGRYAEAEAALAWFNATFVVATGTGPIDPNGVLETLARVLSVNLAAAGAESAHVKLMVSDEEGRISRGNLTVADAGWRWADQAAMPSDDLTILVNARVCTSPEVLADSVRGAIDAVAQRVGADASVSHIESFRPAPPVPTHREVERAG